MSRKKVCVFCSSNNGIDQLFLSEAYNTGYLIGTHGFDLVWGGCDISSMGKLAVGAYGGGAKLFAVIPQDMYDRNLAFWYAHNTKIVRDLSDRKDIMRQSDAFVALPGGFGTLDELFDVISSQIETRKAGGITKPIVVVNINGFYNDLKSFLSSLVECNFAHQWYKDLYFFADSPDIAISYLKSVL